MRGVSRGYRCAAIALALLSNACYTYGSSGLGVGMRPDTRVAADLTLRATLDNEARIGREVERVEGIVSEARGDSLALRLLRTRTRDGEWTTWRGETVAFAVNDFSSVGERRFSGLRTAIGLAALTSVVIIAITTDLFGFGGREGGTDPRPIPPVNPG